MVYAFMTSDFWQGFGGLFEGVNECWVRYAVWEVRCSKCIDTMIDVGAELEAECFIGTG